MRLNSSGQALLETMATLPLLIIVLSGLLFCFYSVTSHYLIDHWVYESSLCLAKQEIPIECKKVLRKKLDFIPFAKFKINTFYRGPRSILISLNSVRPSLLEIKIQDKLNLPIRSSDFKRW